jgi:type VI protein secretion system component VasF
MAMDATNRLSAIAAEMGQLQNEIQEHHRALDFLLKSVRTRVDPARKEARIRATRERIEGLEKRLQALRVEQQELIVHGALGRRGD